MLQALNFLFTTVEICNIAMFSVDLIGEELVDILLLSYGGHFNYIATQDLQTLQHSAFAVVT